MLYRRAFAEYGAEALWNPRPVGRLQRRFARTYPWMGAGSRNGLNGYAAPLSLTKSHSGLAAIPILSYQNRAWNTRIRCVPLNRRLGRTK